MLLQTYLAQRNSSDDHRKVTGPKCMKSMKNLPLDYTANIKTWMISDVFENWLRKLDRKFLLKGRSIPIIVEYGPVLLHDFRNMCLLPSCGKSQ